MVNCKFLAKCPAEFQEKADIVGASAWMACHFSLVDHGISNLPEELPPGSVLILNDQIPIHGHDLGRIRDQLANAAEKFSCCAVLLDLERRDSPENAALVRFLAETLTCPLIVPAVYGDQLQNPVFLPPLPPDMRLKEYLKPWQGRQIWLEAALGGETITLTEQGAACAALAFYEAPESGGFLDEALHCHYSVRSGKDSVRFTLWRTPEDLQALLEEAAALEVTTVGLYQELRDISGR